MKSTIIEQFLVNTQVGKCRAKATRAGEKSAEEKVRRHYVQKRAKKEECKRYVVMDLTKVRFPQIKTIHFNYIRVHSTCYIFQ